MTYQIFIIEIIIIKGTEAVTKRCLKEIIGIDRHRQTYLLLDLVQEHKNHYTSLSNDFVLKLFNGIFPRVLRYFLAISKIVGILSVTFRRVEFAFNVILAD